MSDFFNAFEMSPVPAPGPDAVAPEPFRGIYGMPAFVTVSTRDLAGSADAPVDTPWTTRDVEVVTPEGIRVVLTTARQIDPDSEEARNVSAMGITPPEDDDGVHNR